MGFVEIRSLKESHLPSLFIPNVLLIATFALSIWSTTGTSENVVEHNTPSGLYRLLCPDDQRLFIFRSGGSYSAGNCIPRA